MNQKSILQSAALLGALAVSLGAFGAHAFKTFLTDTGRLETYELAVRYQFYHVFAMLLTGILLSHFPGSRLKYASLCFLLGIFFFCGSLYILCLTGYSKLGAVTPIGGVLFIAGWVLLLMGITQKK
jgi:uncharacterized membrane protein YgdD (TMEM256/DUF423 family)